MCLPDALARLLGPTGWLTGVDNTARYSRDWLDRFGVPPLGIARPSTTQETSDIMRLCHQYRVPVVPQGGRTGLVGASVATDPGCVLLSMSRLNQIDHIDNAGFSVTVGAGVVLASLHEVLAEKNLWFPMHLGSEGSAQIGGLVATNAGGSHAFRFGMMQDLVLGLEVVLHDGQIWDGLRPLIKDNSGFQLRKLFCGSEGRLGVITRAILRLSPAPQRTATALVGLRDLRTALTLGHQFRSKTGEFLSALEFFDDSILGLSLRNIPELKWPMASRAPIYLLIEMSSVSTTANIDAMMEAILAESFEKDLITDAVIAQTETQRRQIWRIREELPEGTLREGRQLKHDIAVPVSQLEGFLVDCAHEVQRILPGVRIWAFGHLADGNIHYNLSPPSGEQDFHGIETKLSLSVYRMAENVGGTFAAEHGTGRTKPTIADQLRPKIERDLMARLLDAFDPLELMNPGVVVKGNRS